MNASEPFGRIPSEFILIGFSWIQNRKVEKLIVSTLFLLLYVAVLVGNCSVVALVKMDEKLHEAMHIFISLLAVVDLTVSSAVVPKALTILWSGSNTVSTVACLTQMYVLYTMLGIESSLFALMSLDRYVAICHPLRRSAIMTNAFITKLVLFIALRNSILLIPIPALMDTLTFCKGNVVSQSYCEYIEVIKLSCGDLTHLVIYMAAMVCLIPGGDNALTIFSYVMILKVVHALKTPEARWKALNTCSSHAILLFLFYASACVPLVLFLHYPNAPLYVKVALEILSCLLLPVINPIVYGVRTKEIQEGFKRLFWKFQPR